MIEIYVSGDRNEGKTTVALGIVSYLRSLGFPVRYIGFDKHATEMGEVMLYRDPQLLENAKMPLQFMVIDTCNRGHQ